MTTYYVSPTGSDSNAGSAALPFQTIQKAASVALAGDSVIINAGTYREKVTFPRSGTALLPITFQAASGAKPVVTGADVVTGWSLTSGAIYQSPLGWDLGAGLNQVFVDGVMVSESRWPYPGTDVSHPVKGIVGSVSFTSDTQGTIVDANLTQPDGFWNGANIHIMGGEEWICSYGTVNTYTKGKFTFTSVNADVGQFFQTYERLRAGNHYYLFGKPFPTQNAGQWFVSGGTLQLWTPASDSPANHLVEVKHRQIIFDFGNQSNIKLTGISIFAGSITSGASSSNILIDGINAKYLSQFVLYNQWWAPADSGITLNGTKSTIQNCVIQYSAGDAIFLAGSNNTALNNFALDTNYSACGGAAIHLWGTGHTIKSNTITNSGRCGINHQAASNLKIFNNAISAVMLQTTDGGGIYTANKDGQNTEIAYNRIWNVHSGGFHSVGIYFDNSSLNFNCHHNLTFDVDVALKMNHPATSIQIVNNTWDATLLGIDCDTPSMGSCTFTQNIFTKPITTGSGTLSGNIVQGTDPQFVDKTNQNYTLLPTTTHPLAGCFPVGQPIWIAGANIPVPSPTPPPVPTPPPAPVPPRLATSLFDATKYDAASSAIKLVPLPTDNFGPANAIGFCNNGEWVKYGNINFGTGVTAFAASIATANDYAGQNMEIHLDSITGTLLGTLVPQGTGPSMPGWYNFMAQIELVQGASGVHDLYFAFKGPKGGICNVKSFTFS